MAGNRPEFSRNRRQRLKSWGLSDAAIRDLEAALPHVAVSLNQSPPMNAVRERIEHVNKPLAAAVRALRLLQDAALSVPIKSDAFQAFNLLSRERDDRHLVDRLHEIADRFAAVEKRVMQRQIIKVDESAGPNEFGYKVRIVRAQHRNRVNIRPIEMIAAALEKHGIAVTRTSQNKNKTHSTFENIVALCFDMYGITANPASAIRAFLARSPKGKRSRGRPRKAQ